MAAIVDQVARELDAPPLGARHWREMVHQRAAFGKEREHMVVAAQIADFLHLGEHVVIAFTHADDQMRAKTLGSEYVGGGMQDFPVLVPAVRRLHAGAPGPIKYVAVTGVERDGEDIGAE